MRLNAKQIVAATGGQFLVNPIEASDLLYGVTWDSREVEPGWLYVALPGEHVDGHEFVPAALTAGARAVLVMDRPNDATMLLAQEMGASIIEVSDTYRAISDLAREWRQHLNARVIGITGSSGKTTTKNLIRDVVSTTYRVVSTKANQNNELGVPRTILAADPDTEVVVVEMGMRGLGQISELSEFVCPDWGLITNIGEGHLELLGSRENIARAKAEIFEVLPAGVGRAFINESDDYAGFIIDQAELVSRGIPCIGFNGTDTPGNFRVQARVWAEDISLNDEGQPCFTLCSSGFDDISAENTGDESDESSPNFSSKIDNTATAERVACKLALRGMHNVGNACAAAAIGRSLGIELSAIVSALGTSIPEGGRQEIIKARGGFTIINDSYNANPDSMRASLAMFGSFDVAGQRYAVLGDMGELGDFSEACHRGIGRVVADLNVDYVICVGELAAFIAEEALAAGMNEASITTLNTVADVLEVLDSRLEQGDAVLVKASHAMGLERVVEGLVS